MTDLTALAARLADLKARRAEIDEAIDLTTDAILATAAPGDTLALPDGTVAFTVSQRRTFSAKAAAEVLPDEVVAACSKTAIDGAAVKRLSPALWEACCTLSAPFVTAAR